MTTYFVDPFGGDDTKDGLSFANRWKTFKNTQTVAAAKGDEYRLPATPGEYDIGLGVFVDNTEFVTLADAATVLKDVDNITGGWVPSNTSTGAVVIQPSKYGAYGANRIGWFDGETRVGKIAHKDLGGVLDLSAFTHLSFLIAKEGGYTVQLDLKLCSDAAGNVPVATLPMPRFRGLGQTMLVGTDGVPLPSNVRSIALHVRALPPEAREGIAMVRIENIVACISPRLPGHVSHSSLVRMVDDTFDHWMPIRSIRGSQLFIGLDVTGVDMTHNTWRGPSGTKSLKAIVPTVIDWWGYRESYLRGNLGVTVSGGWNPEDMSVQDGQSWFNLQRAELHWSPGSSNEESEPPGSTPAAFLTVDNEYLLDAYQTPIKLRGIGFFRPATSVVQIGALGGYENKTDIEGPGIVASWGGFMDFPEGARLVVKDVSWCETGVFALKGYPSHTMANELDELSPAEMIIGSLVAPHRPCFLPNSDQRYERLLVVGKTVDCGWLCTPIKTPGVFMLRNTAMYGVADGDGLNCRTDTWLDGVSWFTYAGVDREPQAVITDERGITLRMDRVQGRSWDSRTHTRLYREQSRDIYSSVVEDKFRTPGYRSFRLDGSSNDGIVLREQAALIPCRAGETTVVSGYITTQGNAPEFGGVSNAWLSTLPNIVPGVGLQRARNVRRPGNWCRVILEITPDVDALVPIFLECDAFDAWATEIKIDESGEPASPPDPVDPGDGDFVVTDRITFTGMFEDLMGLYNIYSGGPAMANGLFESMFGVPLTNMTSSTISNTLGNMFGAVVLMPQPGAETDIKTQLVALLTPGYEGSQLIRNSKLRLTDESGTVLTEILQPPGSSGVVPGSGTYFEYGMFTVANDVAITMMNGATYTLELLRPVEV